MTVALDSSAVLALIFQEPGRERVASALDDAVLSAVNLSEVVGRLIDSGYSDVDAERTIDAFLPLVAPHDGPLAIGTGALRRQTREKGLSLGDRSCLALAIRESATALTADRAWADLDVGVDVQVIR